MLLKWFTGFFFYFEQVIFWLIESAFAACKRLGHMLSQIATACSKSSYQTLKCEAIIIDFDEALDIPFSKFSLCTSYVIEIISSSDFIPLSKSRSILFDCIWFMVLIKLSCKQPVLRKKIHRRYISFHFTNGCFLCWDCRSLLQNHSKLYLSFAGLTFSVSILKITENASLHTLIYLHEFKQTSTY